MSAVDVSSRPGFDPTFLGVAVPLPHPTDPVVAASTVVLDYTHFTVLMRPDRRLACVTGVGIDGATLVDLPRAGIDWVFDPRLPVEEQTGPEVYARNDIGRGHLVRRRDPVWGGPAGAALANADTFHFTNAAPQAAGFNQGETLWAGLEDYLLDNAATYDRKLVVFTGPVLDPGDPLYRGTQIPLRFFKIAVFLQAGELAATGYVLDQTPLVPDLAAVLARAVATGEPPPLGPFRTYQVPVEDIARLTGLGIGYLTWIDTLPATATATAASPVTGQTPEGWRALHAYTDITVSPRRL